MSTDQGLKRKAHFLGTKIKTLRKRNHLTLEDLSVRCVQVDADGVNALVQRRPEDSDAVLREMAAMLSDSPG